MTIRSYQKEHTLESYEAWRLWADHYRDCLDCYVAPEISERSNDILCPIGKPLRAKADPDGEH